MSSPPTAQQDPEDLEALFDSIAAAARDSQAPAPKAEVRDEGSPADRVISQVGQLTRRLHETLCALGYDRTLGEAASAIPDARKRLTYVAEMTEQAAVRALDAIETAKPLQDSLQRDSKRLADEWERLFAGQMTVQDFQGLAQRTRGFLREVPDKAKATGEQLMAIMMAQDFQDLTGQVIKRITDMAQDIENQLLTLLVENCPPQRRVAAESAGLLNGPAIDGVSRADVVTDQGQVDALLESLGF
jgi:chemotaxis protein CheZ